MNLKHNHTFCCQNFTFDLKKKVCSPNPLRKSVFPFRRDRLPKTHILYELRILCHIFLSIASLSCKASISMERHVGFEIDQDLLVLCFFRKESDKRPTFEKDTLLALSAGSLSCCQHMSPSWEWQKKTKQILHSAFFLAVQDSSTTDIVGPLVPWSEPTNN